MQKHPVEDGVSICCMASPARLIGPSEKFSCFRHALLSSVDLVEVLEAVEVQEAVGW